MPRKRELSFSSSITLRWDSGSSKQRILTPKLLCQANGTVSTEWAPLFFYMGATAFIFLKKCFFQLCRLTPRNDFSQKALVDWSIRLGDLCTEISMRVGEGQWLCVVHQDHFSSVFACHQPWSQLILCCFQGCEYFVLFSAHALFGWPAVPNNLFCHWVCLPPLNSELRDKDNGKCLQCKHSIHALLQGISVEQKVCLKSLLLPWVCLYFIESKKEAFVPLL